MSRSNHSRDAPDDCSVNSGISWGGNSYGSSNTLSTSSGGANKLQKIMVLKDAEIPNKNTLEFIELSISSTKREMKLLKSVAGEVMSSSQKSNLRALRKKLKDFEIMLDSITTQQGRGQKPSPTDKGIRRAPFSSSGKREYQVKNLLSTTPHFYLSAKDWKFGSNSFDNTFNMDSFSYTERFHEELDIEKYTKLDVLVGAHRPQSRCKNTDFFGAQANNIIKSRSFSPIAVPKLNDANLKNI